MPEPNEACVSRQPVPEPPAFVPPDVRPWWRKLTNIGIAIVSLAGTAAPILLSLGQTKAAGVCIGLVAAGTALGLKGTARRADRVRSDVVTTQHRSQ